MKGFTMVKMSNIGQLPKTSGVYCFMAGRKILYLGKAVNIRDRVKNHFSQSFYRDNLFIEKVTRVGFIETASEVEALILEANLIKKYQPKFNVVWRDDKNYFYVVITKNQNKIPHVFITHQIHKSKILNHTSKIVGPFVDGRALKKTLKFLRRAFPYYTSKKHPKIKCAWCHLDLCPGPEPNLPEYKKNIKKLILILQGKRKNVLHSLQKEMKAFSNSWEFENAAKTRDRISALKQIMSHKHILSNELAQTQDRWHETQRMLQKMFGVKWEISRIECYDVSNIQGKYATGSMVVFVNGEPDKSQYKKFKIRMNQEPNDIAMLKEILTRRFSHSEWPLPEVMLIDGGIAQLNVAIQSKNKERRTKNIKVISIAKGRQELFIQGQRKPIPLQQLPREIFNLIKHLDNEAHRFAIIYHKKLRKRGLGLDKAL